MVRNPRKAVIADTDTLDTLPDRELSAGLAEVIKYGLIDDPELLELVELDIREVMVRDILSQYLYLLGGEFGPVKTLLDDLDQCLFFHIPCPLLLSWMPAIQWADCFKKNNRLFLSADARVRFWALAECLRLQSRP